MPNGYSKKQIRLHWIIFVLVVLQFVLHEPMSDSWELIKKGQEPVLRPLVVQHVVGGLMILALVIWRLSIRVKRGAPALPKEEHPVLKGLAHLSHWVLFAMLIFMPISGAIAVFGEVIPAGNAHEVMKAIILLFMALHVVGAIFQQFVLKANIMGRMRTPDPE